LLPKELQNGTQQTTKWRQQAKNGEKCSFSTFVTST